MILAEYIIYNNKNKMEEESQAAKTTEDFKKENSYNSILSIYRIIHSKQFLDISHCFLPNTTARVSVAFRSLSSFLRCKLCLLFFLHAVAFRIICDFCRNLFPAVAKLFVFSTNLTLFRNVNGVSQERTKLVVAGIQIGQRIFLHGH